MTEEDRHGNYVPNRHLDAAIGSGEIAEAIFHMATAAQTLIYDRVGPPPISDNGDSPLNPLLVALTDVLREAASLIEERQIASGMRHSPTEE